MTKEEAKNTLKSLKNYYNDKNEDSYVGFDNEDNEALDMAIKALETQDRLTEMLNKQMTAYAEMKKSKRFGDLEYGRMTAYAHCLEVLNDDE